MQRMVVVALAAGIAAYGWASAGGKKQIDNPVPVKFPIRHADPWAVKAMIEGLNIKSPELSTVMNMLGGRPPAAQGNSTSPLLKDGYLVVNPTDNSLWWYPNRR